MLARRCSPNKRGPLFCRATLTIAASSWHSKLARQKTHLLARVTPRLGDRLEIGLHFESKDPADNRELLAEFQVYLLEIKAELGDSVEAELWDRGWTKVYDTLPLAPYEPAYLDTVARRLAEIARVLQPIYRQALRREGGRIYPSF